jgi:hypothetical protein
MNWLPLLLAAALTAVPFWETKPPAQWDQQELVQLLTDSPWAQSVSVKSYVADVPSVLVFLATAAPMRQAEQERERRTRLARKPGTPDPADPFKVNTLSEEYRLWLEDNSATQIVVAVGMPPNSALADEAEIRRMEDECLLHAGRKKWKMTGHFPPSANDPYLRLAFPRQVQLSDKTITLDLYVPGVRQPYRVAHFALKDMVVAGKLEL